MKNGKSNSTPTSSNSPEKLDRKTVERNRRMHMKDLCFKLTSLVPPRHFQPSKDMLSQQEQLDQVATYVKQLKERVDELKARKAIAMGNNNNITGTKNSNKETTSSSSMSEYFRSPVVELRDLGSSLEVNLVTGLEKNFKLSEVIGILHDEGTEVVSAVFSTFGDRVFHTLHAQVRVSRVGVETSRVCQRLQELVCS
ncbi:hypothetical protein RHSIM_Rhsim12G0163800 [Rhododendron simsii]|uniref:BHLH domain-containing protein n=1 Tax=Rhododendron simsii TaxID=118357 RepID=A0A834G371_RHOSS|nr:hypothetical protein RHSIM_Rhsim12G0163800 [Rhododendron simsii]